MTLWLFQQAHSANAKWLRERKFSKTAPPTIFFAVEETTIPAATTPIGGRLTRSLINVGHECPSTLFRVPSLGDRFEGGDEIVNLDRSITTLLFIAFVGRRERALMVCGCCCLWMSIMSKAKTLPTAEYSPKASLWRLRTCHLVTLERSRTRWNWMDQRKNSGCCSNCV